MKSPNDELNGWDEIISDAESGVSAKTEGAHAKAQMKLVLGIVNLGETIFSLQKKLLPRIDDLKSSIDRFNDESSRLYKIYLWLTVVIVLATVANVLIAIFK